MSCSSGTPSAFDKRTAVSGEILVELEKQNKDEE
jgi:hypothetical protein